MSLWKFMVRDPIGHGNLNVTICFIHERSFKILLTYGAQLNKKWNISCRCGLHGINWKLTKKRMSHRESKFLKQDIHYENYTEISRKSAFIIDFIHIIRFYVYVFYFYINYIYYTYILYIYVYICNYIHV